MGSSEWARVRRGEAHGLRRGAWYQVVRHGSSNLVVLDVNKSNRPVHRGNLEFSEHKPDKWSVVMREPSEHAAQRADDASLGPVYAVCPKCRERTTIDREATRLACPDCGAEFDVDWANPC